MNWRLSRKSAHSILSATTAAALNGKSNVRFAPLVNCSLGMTRKTPNF